jgi:hypothetical protein
MKANTNKNQKAGLLNRPEQLGTGYRMSEQEAKERVALIEKRRANRELRTDTVLSQLKDQLPKQYELAEIIGRWIWLEFPKNKHRAAANTLWRLGFHWNQRRSVWQHPCGAFAPYTPHPGDPREKYGSYFPVSAKSA